MKDLTITELKQFNGGGLKEAAFVTVHTIFKYSSLTGAVLTGILEGYIEEKSK